MLPRDVLRQVRLLQFRARRAVADLFGGEYRSIFKGAGLSFEEVREYQPGDDVRAIDWNVTARMGHPFLRRYTEERERTVLVLLDASRSLAFGSLHPAKREVAAELAAVLAFSAITNNDRVGLVIFTERVERFLPPRKGTRHVLRLIREILYTPATGKGTSLRAALEFVQRILRRRSILFLLSDFLDRDFEMPLKRLARSHDLVAVQIRDRLEEALPPVGLVELEDSETGSRRLIDTGNASVRQAFARSTQSRREALERLSRAAGFELIPVSTGGGHLEALLEGFRRREHRARLS